MQIFHNPNYNFVRWRNHWVVFSLLFMVAGAVLFFTKGFDMGIDFSGGANLVLKFKDQPPLNQLRTDLPGAAIQQYGKAEERSLLLRLPSLGREGDYAGATVAKLNRDLNPESAAKHDLNFLGSDRLGSLLKQADPDVKGTNVDAQRYYNALADRVIARRSELGIFTSMDQVRSVEGMSSRDAQLLNDKAFLGKFNVLNQETVGPQVGKELQQKAIWAVVLASIAMGIYIALRFDLMFGVSAVANIIHDVLIALSFMLMLRLEFSLNVVAALLTIVGYSINDTVVMYDRVRENKRKFKGNWNLADQLNIAMNQTLSRTILTSSTVFVVLLALVLFGGEVIRGFAWVMMIGVICGTYSTVTIVPAVALWWEKLTGRRNSRAMAPAPARNNDVVRETTARKRKAS